MAGRLDAAKVKELYRHFGAGLRVTDAFVCGPDSMIRDVSEALLELGMRESHIHSERFGVPRKGAKPRPEIVSAAQAVITVIMDGHKKSFDMLEEDGNIVDAAARQGIELPYSCKGGVCATCRCHVREGEVTMAVNYGLEPWEVDKGYTLACQSRPLSAAVILDYDRT
jgi:ring-1,2-phenylacetyl-CoA epoxidase subunit PaaE